MASPNTKRKEDAGGLNDLYRTPIESLKLAYDNLVFSAYCKYLEPCDGTGAISSFLRDKGHYVVTNELYKDVYNTHQEFNEDFLTTKEFYNNYDCVIMNPPFKEAQQFIEKALECAPVVYVFGRSTLLEGKKRYESLYKNNLLKEVWCHTSRVSCDKGVIVDGNIEYEKGHNAVFYCWFVFDRNNKDECKLRWL